MSAPPRKSRTTASYRVFAASAVAALTIFFATPSFGQGAPSPAYFVQALSAETLRPVPPALRQTRGFPTSEPATTKHAASNQFYRRAASNQASEPRRKPAQQRSESLIAESRPVVPAGCTPAAADAENRPQVEFKVEFEFDSARLKPESMEILRSLGTALNGGLGNHERFEVQGHTDAVGPLSYNEQLSKARAAAVRDFLVNEMKVSPERLAAVGKGYCELANPANPRAPENRRVVVLNHSAAASAPQAQAQEN